MFFMLFLFFSILRTPVNSVFSGGGVFGTSMCGVCSQNKAQVVMLTWALLGFRRESILGMSTNYNSHDFKIKHKESVKLPGKEFPPEAGCFGWDRWIGFILVSINNVCFMHGFDVFIQELDTRRVLLWLYI